MSYKYFSAKEFRFNVFLLFCISIILFILVMMPPQRLSVINYAKDSAVSEQSAQVINNNILPKDNINYKIISQKISNAAVNVNDGFSSFTQGLLSYIIAGALFISIFYLLLKKFLIR